ncbi:MAG TPA: c-type cytochrome biogenesis protein CcsB [Nitrospirae bacterium]|nr:cytochrome c biogenesis protein CcsA [bacterium BMS3Abin10]HDO26236.1 c-type cytochrome biogenesis protein CcsB [Nitrospirota bacterium]HDZ84771.1 c-type cytochrome biogenesis protein CcsB [Nitrospirota bacterium]
MDNLYLLKCEVISHWIAVGFYILSTVFFAYSVSFKKAGALKYGMFLAIIGLIPHSIALGIRWHIAGHGPYMAKYEVLSSNTWVVILMFLLIGWKIPKLRAAGVIVIPLSFLMMTFGLFTNPEIRRLPPALSGVWLVIHILFNKLAVGAILISLGSAVLYLLKKKQGDKEFYRKLPSLEVLDAYSYKFIGFGFIFWSITVAAGSIWANEAWGRYWGWDPIETWSLITWLLYGLYLHLRYFFKWQGTKAAWMLLACFIVSVITIFIIPFVIQTLHSSYFM